MSSLDTDPFAPFQARLLAIYLPSDWMAPRGYFFFYHKDSIKGKQETQKSYRRSSHFFLFFPILKTWVFPFWTQDSSHDNLTDRIRGPSSPLWLSGEPGLGASWLLIKEIKITLGLSGTATLGTEMTNSDLLPVGSAEKAEKIEGGG